MYRVLDGGQQECTAVGQINWSTPGNEWLLLQSGNAIRRGGMAHGSTVKPTTFLALALATASGARLFHYCQAIVLGYLVASRSSPRTVRSFPATCGVPYSLVYLCLLRCLLFDSGVLSCVRGQLAVLYFKKCLLWMRRRCDRE
ncbi:unnamed protein product [Ectocarpus sp. 4 AP-2014]